VVEPVKVIDFYEGAAKTLGFESLAALEDACLASFDIETERLQAACRHLHVADELETCGDCGKPFALRAQT
jgi:hypothetical protein